MFNKGINLLGICLGMQLLADYGEENEGAKGLGWLSGKVKKIPSVEGIRLPHVGWNNVNIVQDTYFKNCIFINKNFLRRIEK